jgi:hypothetical protein
LVQVDNGEALVSGAGFGCWFRALVSGAGFAAVQVNSREALALSGALRS